MVGSSRYWQLGPVNPFGHKHLALYVLRGQVALLKQNNFPFPLKATVLKYSYREYEITIELQLNVNIVVIIQAIVVMMMGSMIQRPLGQVGLKKTRNNKVGKKIV